MEELTEQEYEKLYIRHKAKNTHNVSGRDYSQEEQEAFEQLETGGYSAMMEDVDEMRKITFDTFYKEYMAKTGKTKHEINGELIGIGIGEYNKECKTECRDAVDVMNDMKQSVKVWTMGDTVSSLQDRGLIVLLQKEYGFDNAYEYLVDRGVDIPK